MRDENEIVGAASSTAVVIDVIDSFREKGLSEVEITYILANQSAQAGAMPHTTEFYRGMYRAFTWVLGTDYNSEDIPTN